MILEFLLNACILVTSISISHLIFKDKKVTNNVSLTLKSIIGLCSGLLGIILMLNSVHIDSNIIIDFRYLPILLTAIYGGFLPTIISSIAIGAFRVIYFGVSEPSIIALIVALVVGIGFCIISNFKLSRKKKWVFSIIYLFFITFIAFLIVLKFSILFLKVILTFYFIYICIFYLIFIYTEYLSEFVRLNNILKNEATKDFLTGLNNVRQFDTSFNSISQLTLRKEEELSLLFIDIDFFKKVNDTYGHNKGDIVLKILADIFIDTFRIFDVISRNGGEEFSILLLDCSASEAVEIAERLRKKVETHKFNISDKVILNITISIGISTYPDTTDKIDELLENADNALYVAKRTGRNKVVLYKNDAHLK